MKVKKMNHDLYREGLAPVILMTMRKTLSLAVITITVMPKYFTTLNVFNIIIYYFC